MAIREMTETLTAQGTTAGFVRNAWYGAFWSADLENGALRARTILDEPIVFFRTAEGHVAALEDMCPHRFAPLSLGHVVADGLLECGYHGLRFNSAGSCVYNPHGEHKIPPAANARSYPVVEKHTLIWIWMGDGEPDMAAVPDYHQFDTTDPVHVTKGDYIKLAADYRLITDNLLDLSHVPFLHGGLLGDPKAVVADVAVTQEGNSVTQSRWSYDVPVASVFDMLFRNDGKPVDFWMIMNWKPTGCMILDVGVRAPGSPKESGTGYYAVHILTPETATSTHYHFAAIRFTPPPRPVAEDLELRDKLGAGRRYAFEVQDGPMIEAQQLRMLGAGAKLRPALLSVDAGPIRVQRILAGLVSEERSSRTSPTLTKVNA
jgi:phenylpropionate dioxygenase-like ring-hydroxylating dioxygenase large terminal subunit